MTRPSWRWISRPRARARDQILTFATHVGDVVAAGPDHPIRVVRDPETGEPSPYVLVRANLEALIDRKSFYRLVDIGEVSTRRRSAIGSGCGPAGSSFR